MTFFNIFSNKKQENKRNIITIDNREKNSLVVSELVNQGNKVNFEQLEVGDYIVKDIVIERKTKSDLISSIIDQRIFSQLENMKKYPNYLLIIENNLQSNINENIIKGFILSTIIKSRVPIIFTKDEKETAKYLSILANKKEKSSHSIRPSRTFMTKEQQIQFIIEGFPNIGPIKAKALIKEFKSIKNIINASKEELEKVIGKQAQNMHSLFNQEFEY